MPKIGVVAWKGIYLMKIEKTTMYLHKHTAHCKRVRPTRADTYIHNDDDGNDVIVDSDGDGSIIINGNTTLNGGTQVTGTDYVWQSADHTTYYTRFDQGNGKFTLNITLENKEKIFVKDWADRKQPQVANENEWRVAA